MAKPSPRLNRNDGVSQAKCRKYLQDRIRKNLKRSPKIKSVNLSYKKHYEAHPECKNIFKRKSRKHKRSVKRRRSRSKRRKD